MGGTRITAIHAREILDSRGNPTLQVSVHCGDAVGTFGVPSGASTGSHEALELRDGDVTRWGGKGVLKAIANVQVALASALVGMDVTDQRTIDQRMIALDGTPTKSRLGGNAITGVSVAVAKAAAAAQGIPVYQWLQKLAFGIAPSLPVPQLCMNLTNGGKHASGALAFQEYKVVPQTDDLRESLDIGTAIMHGLRAAYAKKYGATSANVGDEGGFAPDVSDVRAPLEMFMQVATQLHLETKVKLALDVAASSFFSAGSYEFNGGKHTPAELAEVLRDIVRDFPILYIEDPFHEEAMDDFTRLNADAGAVIVGDDLTVTNAAYLQKAIDAKAVSGVIIKVNQVGTLTEALETMKLARAHDIHCIVSHRSGETNDDFIADLAMATGAWGIKAGGPQRGERIAKYNRFLNIASRS